MHSLTLSGHRGHSSKRDTWGVTELMSFRVRTVRAEVRKLSPGTEVLSGAIVPLLSSATTQPAGKQQI